ncbi:Replication stress response regulator SDE2 [Aphelenchoides fujianensis]|nr:Replication stress response regulator SDE2 [Aphelenchoides fujianensis]
MEIFNRRSRFHAREAGILERIRRLPAAAFFLTVGARVVPLDEIDDEDTFELHFRLLGGKGGFKNQLKSRRIQRSSNTLMMRDLTGRRITSVKEEERLRKWISKADERDKEKQRKWQEKYEKLKKTGPKHEFADVDYLRKRDLLLDSIEDAVDAGLNNLEKKPPAPGAPAAAADAPGSSKSTEEPTAAADDEKPADGAENSADDAEDADEIDLFLLPKKKTHQPKLPVLKGGVEKKKRAALVVTTKPKKPLRAAKVAVGFREKTPEKAAPPKRKNRTPPPPPADQHFEPIDLQAIHSAADLHALGLLHLKHALEARGLKCGGTLEERAERLFSVRDLQPADYPKKLLAAKK